MIAKFEKEICEILIQRYQRRYNSGSDFSRKISLKFDESDYKKYVDDNAYQYREAIDAAVKRLEDREFISVSYDRATKDIVEVRLKIDKTIEICKFLNIDNIADSYQRLLDKLQNSNSITGLALYNVLLEKRKNKVSLQRYIDKSADYFDAIKAIDAINNNTQNIYMRKLSAPLFIDSKRLENLKGIILDILTMIDEPDTDIDEYLLINGIIKNPNYIYLKGNAVLKINEQIIDLSKLKTVAAICSDSIANVTFLSIKESLVTTIENLTTFHDYKGEELVVYLGGFSNHSKVELLKKISRDLNGLTFRHFGDMDFGGFSILSHLRRKTEIMIMPLHMDIKMLQDRFELSKKPSGAYIEKLKSLLSDEYLQDCREVLRFMIDKQVILEQETY